MCLWGGGGINPNNRYVLPTSVTKSQFNSPFLCSWIEAQILICLQRKRILALRGSHWEGPLGALVDLISSYATYSVVRTACCWQKSFTQNALPGIATLQMDYAILENDSVVSRSTFGIQKEAKISCQYFFKRKRKVVSQPIGRLETNHVKKNSWILLATLQNKTTCH